MSPPSPTSEDSLVVCGTHWNHGVSPAVSPVVLQHVRTDFYAWVDGVSQNGILRGSRPLVEAGNVVTGAKGAGVRDGAFVESTEAS